MIDATHIERAESAIANIYQIAQGVPVVERVCMAAQIDSEAVDNLIRAHLETLTKQYMPDIDPRHEAGLATMFLHMLAVGAVAQRASDGRL